MTRCDKSDNVFRCALEEDHEADHDYKYSQVWATICQKNHSFARLSKPVRCARCGESQRQLRKHGQTQISITRAEQARFEAERQSRKNAQRQEKIALRAERKRTEGEVVSA